MLSRATALLVAVLLLGLLGPAAVASAQRHVPDDPGSEEIPWWEEDDPDAPVQDVTPPQSDPGTGLDDLPLPGVTDGDLPVDDEPEVEPEPLLPTIPVPTTKTIPGTVAYVRRDGKAAIPRGAPKRVRQLIAAANEIVGKPYKWGGGHAKLKDRGYDCSGAVSYALIRTGLLRAPLVSGSLARWGSRGAGRWVSVHANRGHVYLEVAGLRLDTSAVGDRGGRKGVRWRPVIGRRGGFTSRHPAGL
ncbi:hypothetical protein [Paraconexibacter algicola]|uniref:NlpC/P60 domain-containing protein n=1 Tax=Paraconexibacter algicola TaxID=2133960 RepID=A0A2T4ULK6_9ACTN|nr:hypothetical protein [Paraconexibacter algicola]PTL60088.1 hypothetical protein C7Y72_10750 [Paraconexibacter algicola]